MSGAANMFSAWEKRDPPHESNQKHSEGYEKRISTKKYSRGIKKKKDQKNIHSEEKDNGERTVVVVAVVVIVVAVGVVVEEVVGVVVEVRK